MTATTDRGEIEDIAAVEDCSRCGWSPAAVVLSDGEWTCFGCGGNPDENL